MTTIALGLFCLVCGLAVVLFGLTRAIVGGRALPAYFATRLRRTPVTGTDHRLYGASQLLGGLAIVIGAISTMGDPFPWGTILAPLCLALSVGVFMRVRRLDRRTGHVQSGWSDVVEAWRHPVCQRRCETPQIAPV